MLDAQVVDVTTCEPVTNAMLEIWACNATGVYSGIVASGNGVGTADPSNLNNTALRGLQPTDEDGVASFDTLFPGHVRYLLSFLSQSLLMAYNSTPAVQPTFM